MKNTSKTKFVTAALAATIAVSTFSCAKKDDAQDQMRTIQEIQAQQGVPVTVATAQKGTIRHIERTSGTVEGIRQSFASSGAGGMVQRISVRTGQRVREGEIIASMYFEDGSPRSVAQANYDHAERMFERVQRLHAEGAATQEQVEAARVGYENAHRGLRGARVAEFVTAPFAGVVLEIFESEGTRIDARTAIANIADFSSVRLDAMINQLNIDKYAVGQRAFAITDNQDTVWGRATSVAAGALAQTHSFRVRFEFPNPENKLRVGTFKEIFVIVEEKQNAVSVPIDVIVYRAGKPGVYVLDGDIATWREVKTGINSGSYLEILSGVEEGDIFVLTGASLLSDGAKVNIVR